MVRARRPLDTAISPNWGLSLFDPKTQLPTERRGSGSRKIRRRGLPLPTCSSSTPLRTSVIRIADMQVQRYLWNVASTARVLCGCDCHLTDRLPVRAISSLRSRARSGQIPQPLSLTTAHCSLSTASFPNIRLTHSIFGAKASAFSCLRAQIYRPLLMLLVLPVVLPAA